MIETQRIRETPAFRELVAAAMRLGRDPLQVQGPGGNVSVKAAGDMLVKASGTWLADAAEGDIFAAVDAAALKTALLSGDPRAHTPQSFQQGDGLRPSIETSFHAALDAPVVLHTHCVATIARSLSPIPKADLEALRMVRVPYVMPGADLARAILSAWRPGARGAVLVNHGIVVVGETVVEAEAVLQDAARHFHTGSAPQATAAQTFAADLEGSNWRALCPGATTALAFDRERLALATGAALYPDQVVFLGPKPVVSDSLPPPSLEAAPSGLALIAGRGAAVPVGASRAVLALAESLGEVVFRIADNVMPTRLTEADILDLMGWDAEKHRQALEAERTKRQAKGTP